MFWKKEKEDMYRILTIIMLVTFMLLGLSNQKTVHSDYNTVMSHKLRSASCRPIASVAKIKDDSNGPLKHYRVVSFYGHPKSTQMGILGRLTPNQLVKKLNKLAGEYSNLDCRPVKPAIELITTVAQRTPGENHLYYHETSLNDIEKYVNIAKKNHFLLILDVQLGRDSIIHQVKLMKRYLKLPFVHLAIDTEFHVTSGQIPGKQLGHVDGYNIQKAINYVSDLTQQYHLPDKVVIIHQFKGNIIKYKNVIKPTKNTEVVLNFDGFGSISTKKRGYQLLVENDPIQYGGFKLFYRQDVSLLTPKEVLKLNPSPAFIDYQ